MSHCPSQKTVDRSGSPLPWGALVVGLVLILACLVMWLHSAEQWQQLIEWVVQGSGRLGPLTLFLLYVLAVVCLAPLSPFALAGGLLLGFWEGAVVALLAVNCGALISFLLARYWLRKPVNRLLQRSDRCQTLMQVLGNDDIRVIALLRLNPLVPFSMHNFVYGALNQPVSLSRYLLGTLLGSAPFTLMLVYLGFAGRVIFISGAELSVVMWLVAGAVMSLVPLVVMYVRLRDQSRQFLHTAVECSRDE